MANTERLCDRFICGMFGYFFFLRTGNHQNINLQKKSKVRTCTCNILICIHKRKEKIIIIHQSHPDCSLDKPTSRSEKSFLLLLPEFGNDFQEFAFVFIRKTSNYKHYDNRRHTYFGSKE